MKLNHLRENRGGGGLNVEKPGGGGRVESKKKKKKNFDERVVDSAEFGRGEAARGRQTD